MDKHCKKRSLKTDPNVDFWEGIFSEDLNMVRETIQEGANVNVVRTDMCRDAKENACNDVWTAMEMILFVCCGVSGDESSANLIPIAKLILDAGADLRAALHWAEMHSCFGWYTMKEILADPDMTEAETGHCEYGVLRVMALEYEARRSRQSVRSAPDVGVQHKVFIVQFDRYSSNDEREQKERTFVCFNDERQEWEEWQWSLTSFESAIKDVGLPLNQHVLTMMIRCQVEVVLCSNGSKNSPTIVGLAISGSKKDAFLEQTNQHLQREREYEDECSDDM